MYAPKDCCRPDSGLIMTSTRRTRGGRPGRLYGNHKRVRVVPVAPIVSKNIREDRGDPNDYMETRLKYHDGEKITEQTW